MSSTADLKDKRIGVLLGSVHDTLATKNYPDATILRNFVVDVSIAYSEKNGRVTLEVETEDTGKDPLHVADGDDGLGVKIVKGIPETIEHKRENGRSRFDIAIKTG